MTVPPADLPPPQPDYVSPPPPPAAPARGRPWAISEILSWCIILTLVVLLCVVSTLSRLQGASERDNPALTSAARVAVAQHDLLHAAPADTQKLLSALDELAKSPSDKLRVAIVAGEFDGPSAALERLDKLAPAAPVLHDDIDLLRQLYQNDASPPPAAWQPFHDRYGWFADLALSHGRPASDPLRQRVMHAVYLALAGYGFVGLGTVLFGLGGAVLLILAIVFWAKGVLRPAFSPAPEPGAPPFDRRVYVQAFAWYLGSYIGFSLLFAMVLRSRSLWVDFLALPIGFLMGLLWPLLMRQSVPQWRAALGLHAGRGFFREIGAGLLGYITGFPIIALAFLLVALLAKVFNSPSHPIEQEIGQGSWAFKAFLFAVASIWAPITEELMFRGALFAHMRERFGFWISACVVGIIFAVIHPTGWAAVPALFAIALVLAAIREWRGTILANMAAHSLHNTLIMIFALLTMT